ncbi:hypothetical protein PGT21_007766 [Puccinia graminis f. sp. tritici]|uniref:Uncharacterized protein n=1 Tax=Puccinia graminis f. sp. tritici TaxID=56615 RepID=A0A5B0PCX3_PUCGR|nr:hypothetical protein PGT21_007766 [Puccinia graminis f. sp. tritici]KAA1123247.1 hypothetical protein PGTUg99_015395 [Puccinia graminis f. sp. tritici]
MINVSIDEEQPFDFLINHLTGQKRIYVEQREDGARRTISKEPRDPLLSLYRTEGLGDTYINTSGKANSEDGQLCAEQQENDAKHSKF